MLPAKWNRFLIVIISAEFLMGASGCPSNAPEFSWHPDIYVHDAQTQSMVRKQDGVVHSILCQQSEFNDYVSVRKDEIAKAEQAYFDVVNQCDHWKGDLTKQECDK